MKIASANPRLLLFVLGVGLAASAYGSDSAAELSLQVTTAKSVVTRFYQTLIENVDQSKDDDLWADVGHIWRMYTFPKKRNPTQAIRAQIESEARDGIPREKPADVITKFMKSRWMLFVSAREKDTGRIDDRKMSCVFKSEEISPGVQSMTLEAILVYDVVYGPGRSTIDRHVLFPIGIERVGDGLNVRIVAPAISINGVLLVPKVGSPSRRAFDLLPGFFP